MLTHVKPPFIDDSQNCTLPVFPVNEINPEFVDEQYEFAPEVVPPID